MAEGLAAELEGGVDLEVEGEDLVLPQLAAFVLALLGGALALALEHLLGEAQTDDCNKGE
eukprot:CAMPEP_0170482288 /NCGR_PEP_ID=MMETSP0208-20121228/2378_1 /TAXON_ID=197538 /ORGANISM="Strombidium inclinatum, Strain S3" /LENGTH=59 /DNA_ID=CAMNT_0010755115 /DNA_START=1328 /DNA_END=1507 /DNA_ORIENTATION=+